MVPYSRQPKVTCGRVCLQSFDVKGVIVRFIDNAINGGIVDHHCLNFLSIMNTRHVSICNNDLF